MALPRTHKTPAHQAAFDTSKTRRNRTNGCFCTPTVCYTTCSQMLMNGHAGYMPYTALTLMTCASVLASQLSMR